MSVHGTPPSDDAPEPHRWDVDRLSDMISAHAPDGTYRFVSAAARELLGYEPQELMGRWAYDLFHPDDVPRVSGVHRSVLDGAPATVVYRLRHKSGEYRWVETTTRVVDGEDGEAREIVCCTRPARERPLQSDSASYDACVARIAGALQAEAIVPVFQPVVSLADGRAIAYEALSRFPGDPGHTPDRWFADAWQVDLGVPLELLSVRAAIDALPLLPADAALCVNVSPETVATPGFRAALGDAAHRVIAEITEHRRLEEADFEQRLAPLRAAGGRVAIDDFGAGHASLSQVLAVSPDWIKLDMTLTQRLDESPVARALASALVSFAAEVGIGVIAEGVERADQVRTLEALGIRYAQGYWLGRPARAELLLDRAA
ncbi:MAG TPA: EAL domain-containing protein [Conexibacter sp.]|nr:EAL domain-containing protein [Conexibacter sp.]